MDRTQKEQVVASLKDEFLKATTIVVTHYKGLTVDDITSLRKSMLNLGASFKVTKNNLAKLALLGTEYEQISSMFSGPTAVASSDDPVAAAKAVVDFSKENDNLVIIGGAINDKIMGVDDIQSLAKLPSLDELRAKIVGMISTPATRIAGVAQAPAGQIARILNAYSQQG